MIRPSHSTIALEIGSDLIRGAVLDLEAGELVSECSCAFPDPIGGLAQGHIEIDPALILARVRQVLGELSEQVSSRSSVWVCGQMGGLILADDRGRPASNYISWQDQRTVQASPGMRSSFETLRLDWPEKMFASLGRELQAGSTSSLLHWLSEHRQLRDGVLPLSIADFCISHFAKQPGTMHTTQAIGLIDLSKSDWHYGAMERIGLGDLWWPELVSDDRSMANWKIGSHQFRVHGSYGEQQCLLYGVGLGQGDLSIQLSTGPQVSVLSDRLESGAFQTRAYFGDCFLHTILQPVAGGSMVEDCFRGAQRLSSLGPWASVVLSGGLSSRLPHLEPLIAERFPGSIRWGAPGGSLLGLLRLAQRHSKARSSLAR